ncbi:GerAB/ArcD/ProY family transporter [Bacillus sp. 03113]|uniref:GerAB/ArcD/ProY family transporter n=1 Tax=Bacillus sp. 03113 TaxID=2578211 RepID=UPI001143BC48|nr:GerAB/ArcD/ProY family transporter [Bacillus sp. 03113]
MEKINKYQLFAMIILFLIGSSTLFELGIDAKQDAWIAVIIGMLASLVLLLLFLSIQKQEPDKNISQIFVHYFGSLFGSLLVILYSLYFMYESMRNIRDFGELTLMTFLPQTPIAIVMLIMVVLSLYAIYKGIEVVFRIGEFILPGVLFFHLLLFVLYICSDIVHFDNLLPILENGLLPVVKKTYPEPIYFPFGQMVIFLMFWSYLNEQEKLIKTSLYAYLTSGILIMLHSLFNVVILGTTYTKISNIALLSSVRIIQIADVFERFDALVILLIFAGLFIKATLWYLAAVLGLGQILKKDYRKLAFPVGIILYGACFLEPNWVTHLWIGDIIANKYYVNPIFIIILPLLLFFVILVRKGLTKKKDPIAKY